MSKNEKKQFGFVGWDRKSNGFKDQSERIPFIRLEDGNNILRIVTDVALYNFVRYKGKDDKGYGRRINTAYPLHDNCPAYKYAHGKVKERYMVGVIDRRDSEVKVFDMSVLVYEQLQNFQGDPEVGSPDEYDINIRFNSKSTTPAGFYSVIPRPKSSLNEHDVELLAEKRDALIATIERLVTPPSPEAVAKRLEALGWKAGEVAPVLDGDEGLSSNAADLDFSRA